jgi:pilus assembly protein CpaB
MRARTLILFLVAVMLAGGTAILVRSWLAQRAAEATARPVPPPPMPQKSILVARGEIYRGQILKPTDLAWQRWAEGDLHRAYIQEGSKPIDAFDGWVARGSFGPGEPITEAKIVAPGSRGFLAAALRPGMRAVSVPVTSTSDISGFVLPGDQVDILVTHQLPSKGDKGEAVQRSAAETVLHDVRVIAVDQKLDSKSGETVLAHTATLEVTPKQSEMVALATEMGKLSLSLRSLEPSSTEQANADSSGGTNAPTFTLDSDVSQLLIRKDDSVIILRGGGKSG